jgi:hypothetical protein
LLAFGTVFITRLCARSQTELLLADAGEVRRLNRFWIRPVRSAGVFPFTLLGRRMRRNDAGSDK